MGQAIWNATANGSYWLDFDFGGQKVRCMLDTGVVDPLNEVGFDLEASEYDSLKQAGVFGSIKYRWRRDASGHQFRMESSEIRVQLIDPVNQQLIPPPLTLWASRGTPGVPSRVGVVFFHHLVTCEVIWKLNSRTWCVVYP